MTNEIINSMEFQKEVVEKAQSVKEVLSKLNIENVCIVKLDKENNVLGIMGNNIPQDKDITEYNNYHYTHDVVSSLIENKDDTSSVCYFWEINLLNKIVKANNLKSKKD